MTAFHSRSHFHTFFAPIPVLVSLATGLALTSCDQVTTNDYEATALVTYTWQVEYIANLDRPSGIRQEKFASTSLLNRNGQQPEQAVTGPDDRGLWYPALPPRPTPDEMAARQQGQERVGTPELIKGVEYAVTYTENGQSRTLPTNAAVYRQVSQAVVDRRPLEFLVGGDGSWIQQAKPR